MPILLVVTLLLPSGRSSALACYKLLPLTPSVPCYIAFG